MYDERLESAIQKVILSIGKLLKPIYRVDCILRMCCVYIQYNTNSPQICIDDCSQATIGYIWIENIFKCMSGIIRMHVEI